MTREESLTITEMVLTHWRASWAKDEIDAFARSIEHMDAEIATSTVLRASKELAYPPKIAEFHDCYRAERRRLRPEIEPVLPRPVPMPLWVRRWIFARCYADPPDMRRFPEQGEWGDKTQEMMPEGAWVEESANLSDQQLRSGYRRVFRS